MRAAIVEQHSPGPWRVDISPATDAWQIWRSDEPVWIGEIWTSDVDANLIAAAPDGLEFARAVTEWMATLGPDNMSSLTGRLYEQGLAFIAKATGGQS